MSKVTLQAIPSDVEAHGMTRWSGTIGNHGDPTGFYVVIKGGVYVLITRAKQMREDVWRVRMELDGVSHVVLQFIDDVVARGAPGEHQRNGVHSKSEIKRICDQHLNLAESGKTFDQWFSIYRAWMGWSRDDFTD